MFSSCWRLAKLSFVIAGSDSPMLSELGHLPKHGPAKTKFGTWVIVVFDNAVSTRHRHRVYYAFGACFILVRSVLHNRPFAQ